MTKAGAMPRRYGARRTAAAEFTVWIAGSYSDGPGFDSLAPHQSGLKGWDGGPDERESTTKKRSTEMPSGRWDTGR